jgi:basic membrane protein A
MPKWLRTVVLPLSVLAIVAAACSEDTTSPGSGGTDTGSAPACPEDLTVGIAYDVGGLGDKSFNDAANAGVEAAIAAGQVCRDNVTTIEADSTGSNRDANIQALADAGNDYVEGVGFAFSEGINKIAPDYPDVQFGIIDGFATCGTVCGLENDAEAIPNVADLTFKEEEGSFLVGAAAASLADSLSCDTIGFLGGQTGPLIGKFQAGYEAGVAAVNDGITILVEYIGDDTTAFVDPVKGKAKATTMFNDGACIIYHAAGLSGNGMIEAAAELDKIAIGVDSDQYQAFSNDPAQQAVIFTSMLKRVDTATQEAIETVGTGGTVATTVFALADEGVGYSQSNTDLMTQEIIDLVDGFADQIVNGEITVPSEPQQ